MIRTIILIDDDTTTLTTATMLLKRLAKREGFELNVPHYRSGHAFLASMDRGEVPDVDLILLDFDMPGTDGSEIARLLRQRFPDVPLIIYTAYKDDTRQARAREAGATAFAEKTPTRIDEQFDFFVQVARDQLINEAPDWLVLFGKD